MRTMVLCGVVMGLSCLLACSSKHNAGADGGMSGTGAGGSGSGTGGSSTATGTGGMGTGGMGTGGRGTGGRSSDGGFVPMCDTTVMAETTCGSTTCPVVSAQSAQFCSISCCLNGVCGTRNTMMGSVSDCAVPAMADPRCPTETVNGRMRQGCCTADNQCGVLRGGGCTERTMTDAGLNALACDDTDAGH